MNASSWKPGRKPAWSSPPVTADGFRGELKECDEGDLQWISREFLDALPKWEGDQIFLDLLWQGAPFFLLTLRYSGDKLVEAVLDGKKIR